MNVKDKILGSILGAAVGDAMGAVTETRSIERIKEDFGGFVDDLLLPPDDCFAHGYPVGAVTEDFSLAYFTGKALAESEGKVTEETAKKALLTWADYPEYVRFAGPTTEAAIRKLKGEEVYNPRGYIAANNLSGTNGSGMKIFCVGLINPGNVDKAIDDTITMCAPTHNTPAALAGGASIAAAVACAMGENATLDDVIAAGIYGARKGYALAQKTAARLAVPNIEKRTILAVDLAVHCVNRGMSWEETMTEIRDIVGAGLNCHEAMPCVFAILAATRGDAMSGIKMGVNIGDDTDTIATMVGAIAGALYGVSNIPERYIDVIEKANRDIDLRGLAREIEEKFYK